MPTVSAANPPYTGVPTVEPISDPAVRSEQFRINVDPEQFGAGVGRAVSGLGQTIGEAGNVAARGAIAQQELQNKIVADDTNNQFQKAATDLLYTGPNALFAKKGADFLSSYQGTMQQLEQLRSNHAANLNAPTRVEFNRDSRYYLQSEYRSIGFHADQAQLLYGDDVNKAKEDNALRGIATHANDPVAVAGYTQQLLESRLARSALKGETQSPDILQQNLASSQSDAAVQRIRALAHDQPETAKQILQENKGILKGPLYDQLEREVNGLAENHQAHALAQEVMGLPGGSGTTRPRPQSSNQYPGQGSEFLKNQRASHAQEIENTPGLKDEILAMAKTEDEADPAGPIESLFNRAAYTGQSLKELLHSGFYGPINRGELPGAVKALSDPDLRARMEAGLNTVIGGSNRLKGATDQGGAGDPNAGWQGGRIMPPGGTASAIYNDWGGGPGGHEGAAQFRQEQQQKVSGAAQPAAGQPKTAASATPPKLEVWGDSLGVGLNTQLKTAGTTHGDDSPETIFKNIQAKPEDYWQGKTVVLSSGSNGNDMDNVERTMSYLMGKGANVIAVGYGPKFPQKNAQLRETAGRLGVPVIDAEGVGATEGVHPGPQGYASMATKIKAQAAAQGPSGSAGPQDAAGAGQPANPIIEEGPAATTRPPVPAAPTQPDQPPAQQQQRRNLADIENDIFSRDVPDEVKQKAWNEAKSHYMAMEADEARQTRLQDQQAKDALHKREDQIWADVYSNNPKITASSIATDPAFAGFTEERNRMISLINNPPGSAIPAAQSAQAAKALLGRMRLPPGDPQRLTDISPIYEAAIGDPANGIPPKINKNDLDFLKKEFTEAQTANGEQFNTVLEDLKKHIGPMMTRSNPMMGTVHPEGDAQVYNFDRAVAAKKDQYLRENKNPMDLLDPKNPDFVGAPAFLAPFQTSMQQSVQDVINNMNKPHQWPGLPTPTAPATTEPNDPQRKPGESAEDYYLRRHGGAAPPPPPPAQPQAPLAR
jgi:hypothetical protein